MKTIKINKKKILFLERKGEVYNKTILSLISAGYRVILAKNLIDAEIAISGFQPKIIVAESWFIQGDTSILKKWGKLIKIKDFVLVLLINPNDLGFQKLIKFGCFNLNYRCIFIKKNEINKIIKLKISAEGGSASGGKTQN